MDKIYLLGDSITQGLGSKMVNFAGELQKLLGGGYSIVNLAYTGTTIDYALGLLDDGKVEKSEDGRTACIIVYGNVDAQIRPNRQGKVFPYIPKRYRGGGMLMPRPFYSHAPWKNAFQHVDNLTRRLFTSLIKAVDGTEQWIHLGPFGEMYSNLLDRLVAAGVDAVCCSCVYIDERLFPGCQEQYRFFNERIESAALERGLPYVDLYELLSERVRRDGWDSVYNKDHFHPSGEGYRLMAKEIAQAVLAPKGGASGRPSLLPEASSRFFRHPWSPR